MQKNSNVYFFFIIHFKIPFLCCYVVMFGFLRVYYHHLYKTTSTTTNKTTTAMKTRRCRRRCARLKDSHSLISLLLYTLFSCFSLMLLCTSLEITLHKICYCLYMRLFYLFFLCFEENIKKKALKTLRKEKSKNNQQKRNRKKWKKAREQ